MFKSLIKSNLRFYKHTLFKFSNDPRKPVETNNINESAINGIS